MQEPMTECSGLRGRGWEFSKHFYLFEHDGNGTSLFNVSGREIMTLFVPVMRQINAFMTRRS